MLNEETIQKLLTMKLTAMAATLRAMSTSPPTDAVSIDEAIGMLVEDEWTARENKRLERLLKDARVPPGACIEDLACDPARGIDKSLARSLASCRWVRAKQNVIVLGATGVGKTFLGGALAQGACRQGLRAFCIRTPRLLQRLAVARAEGTYSKELARLEKISVLVLDDFLLAPMSDVERRDLLEVLEDRTTTPPPSSRPNFRRRVGTRRSETQQSPTPSAIGSSTTPTSSR
jgi:DNA replication protein DnaC